MSEGRWYTLFIFKCLNVELLFILVKQCYLLALTTCGLLYMYIYIYILDMNRDDYFNFSKAGAIEEHFRVETGLNKHTDLNLSALSFSKII